MGLGLGLGLGLGELPRLHVLHAVAQLIRGHRRPMGADLVWLGLPAVHPSVV